MGVGAIASGSFRTAGMIDALRREGFRVIVPDQIGYGRSSKPIIPYNFNDMARNTNAILQSLKIGKAMIKLAKHGGQEKILDPKAINAVR